MQTWLYEESTNASDLPLEWNVYLRVGGGEVCKDPEAEGFYSYGANGKSAEQFRLDQEQFPFPEYAFCPLPCTESMYRVDGYTSTTHPSSTVSRLGPLYNLFTRTEKIMEGERSEALLYFGSNSITKLREEQTTSMSTLVGTLGGNMGLWMGMSVMTFFEFVELAFIAVCTGALIQCGCRQRSGHPQREKGQPARTEMVNTIL